MKPDPGQVTDVAGVTVAVLGDERRTSTQGG
jgi:hypothetical protein